MKIKITQSQLEKLQSQKNNQSERFLTCTSCKKKFTQTIYKGKKSEPICPHCGKHN